MTAAVPDPGPSRGHGDGPARLELAALPELGPGENTQGGASGAAWSYVLPDRELGTIVYVGRPTAATLVVLRQIGRDVIIVPLDQAIDPWPVAEASVGLVVAADAGSSPGPTADQIGAELDRVLAPGGTALIGLGSIGPERATPALPRGLSAADLLWLGARDGEIRAAVPYGDPVLIDYVAARWDDDREIHSRLKRIVRRIRRGPQKGPETRLGALRLPPGAGGVGSPPRYIREIAAAAGRPIDDHRWALLDPGSYGTKKILLFLVGPDDAGPGLVVKLVRDPRFNPRLERAWRGLGALEARGPELSRLGPRPAFFGHHAGLALMAESIVTGDSLKSRLGDAAGDPLIGTVVDRLVELGIATADATRARPAEIAAELGSMVDRYASIYDSTTSERDMLWDAVRRIGATNGPVPLVLQHGDAGTWNVIIDRASEPVLIDWEAAVPHGMPLWDLFYFVRSAAVGVARRNGTRDLLAGLDRTLIRGGPLADLLAGAADRFCAATGLERDLVEPLFHLCWMHRALKTSSTVRVDRLARAHYRRLVAVGMERRDAPGLQRIFAGEPPEAG